MATPNSHDEWQTPPELVAVLDAEFAFDLDAAATENNAINNIPWLGRENDALISLWDGEAVWFRLCLS